jgi:hypothetical protein
VEAVGGEVQPVSVGDRVVVALAAVVGGTHPRPRLG